MSAADRVPLRDWIAVLGGVLGAFMAVLDIQITNASLSDIEGGLSASSDQGSWISTAYLVAEIVVIPLTGWLSRVFSLRLYLIANTVLFLIFSMLCGTASNLGEMILFRVGQGFTGGVLIPTALTIILSKLPSGRQPVGLAMFGVTATFAPAIGPTIGGWLTDAWSWHWIFFINAIPALAVIGAVWYGVAPERMQLHLLKKGDWLGIFFMAIGLGSLIAMLEEGEEKAWFTTEWIRYAAITAALAIPTFIVIELVRREPFLNLRLLARRGFGSASLLGLVMGLGLYGSVYLLPVYLGQVQGYDALQIGEVVMWAGAPQLLIIPFVPMIMKRVDARLLVAFGFVLFGVSCVMNGYMSPDTAGPELRLPQLVRALGQPFIIVPLSALATGGLARADQAQGSALFNMFRNLGGSLGIAMLSTFTTMREHYHFDIISQRLTITSPDVHAWLDHAASLLIARGTPAGLAAQQALGELAAMVRSQAYTMTYADCFFGMGVVLIGSIVLLALMPRPKAGGAVAAH
ncbi:MAG TPA: DHA2 family efflux MFS transporter permease subunit [Acetobacteraceae bacterium]|nr:DHA2 family efflux MFS transporter permease subunit [Acetobacteraceae bacterium]